ncbi:transcriptional regulator family: Helix-turn-helix and Homeodomain-like HTH [Penicillium lividum]|nr:transcriptional regulator family: Helix-turn-helix and Homeodomain-like HTH [Penicillium lividum]
MPSLATEISQDRKKNSELSTKQRPAIIHARQEGVSATKLAQGFKCSRGTIYSMVKRFQETNGLESRSRSGRPEVISKRAQQYLHLKARRHPSWTDSELSAMLPESHARSTVKRVLKRFGIIRSVKETSSNASARKRASSKEWKVALRGKDAAGNAPASISATQ